jgi:translation initiation factor 2 beta subunit (eIF-2beta)/eIF-5
MKDNKTVAQIWREISRRVDFDPKRLVKFYKEHQKARAAKGPAQPER